jgi:ATP-binding cassette subfamily B protein RaxB
MFTYSSLLAFVALALSALVLGYRIALLRGVVRQNEKAIALEAVESGNLMETIRGIQAIKLFNIEGARRQSWMGLKTQSLNAQIALGRRSALLEVGSTFLSEIDRSVIMVLALLLIINGGLTLGMMVAFLAYAQFFRTSVTKLSELWIEMGIARVHLARISDIVVTGPEDSESDLHAFDDDPGFRTLELRDVSFRYAQGEALILAKVNLTIRKGDKVVIVGPSGGGKTTLLKILLGALRPESGQMLLNGAPLFTEHMRDYRSMIGVVSQDDVLYAGTILDNISFFDPSLDSDMALQAAMTAQISDEIFKMPMKFQSLVGDMGSALSGGQKQRLLLARALYKNPQILFIDEGTSHLDVETERNVYANLQELDLTLVSVAHRPHALASAKRVVSVSDGCVKEMNRSEIPAPPPALAASSQ